MRICYFGTFEADYDRNRILVQGLRELGHEVHICHEPLWEGKRHKTGAVKSPTALLSMGKRLAGAYASLTRRYLSMPDHDVVIVGYLGHVDVFPARALTWMRNKPLVFDAFVSLFDTLVGDRGMIDAQSAQASALKLLDKSSCTLADYVLLDTQSHIDYFSSEFGIDPNKFQRIWVGADQGFFYRPDDAELPGTVSNTVPGIATNTARDTAAGTALDTAAGTALDTAPNAASTFNVLHYSKFAPLHGLEYMLEAAKLLEWQTDIRFQLVGGGQIKEEVDRFSRRLGLTNVDRIDWMTPDELRSAIAQAGATLGIFGDTNKASRVIPNKVYQCMAVGAPIITRDSPGIRELLEHEKSALLCPPANAEAIAEAIQRLYNDRALGARLADNARRIFQENCEPAELCKPLERLLERAIA